MNIPPYGLAALAVGAVAALVFLALRLMRLSGRGGRSSRHPYQKHSILFAADDLAFYRALKLALGGEYEIFGKIPVDAIIVPKKGARAEVFSPIAGRQFDFVLCEPNNLAVVCAIQLHDKADPGRQAEPDDPLPAICESLSLPLVRFQVRAEFSAEDVGDRLRQAMVKEPFFLQETDGRKEPRISNIKDIKF